MNEASPPRPENGAKPVLLNTAAEVFARFGGLVIGLVMTPFLITSLGEERYGLWAVLGSLAGYFGLLDLGLGATFVRFLAQHAARGEPKQVRQIMTLGFGFYLLLGALLWPLAHGLAPHLVRFLKLSPELGPSAVQLFLTIYVYFFATSACSIFGALLSALGRMRITALVGLGGQVAYSAAVVLLVQRGWGLQGVAAALFLQLAVNASALAFICRRLYGPIWANPLTIESGLFRQLLSFGGWLQLNKIADTINQESDRFLIAGFVSVAQVTPYEIANRPAFLTKMIPLGFLGALLPKAASLQAPEALNRLYVRGSRYLALITLGLAGFVMSIGPVLVLVWMGRAFPGVPLLIGILVLSYALHNMTGVATTVLRASGTPRYEAYYSILGAAVNLAATLALAPRYGLLGILLGTAIGSIVGSSFMIGLFHRLRRLPWGSTVGWWLYRLSSCVLLAGGAIAAFSASIPSELLVQRQIGLPILMGLGLLYAGLLGLLLTIARFWLPEDRDLLLRLLPASWGERLARSPRPALPRFERGG